MDLVATIAKQWRESGRNARRIGDEDESSRRGMRMRVCVCVNVEGRVHVKIKRLNVSLKKYTF